MMAKKLLVAHLQALTSRLKNDYSLSAAYFGREAIHELRVDIKRLRAFLNLVDVILGEEYSGETLAKLERLFKRAGKVRHFQLEMDTTKRHIDDLGLNLDWFYNLLKAEELIHRRRFAAFCSNFDLHFLDRNPRKLGRRLEQLDSEYVARQVRGHADSLLEQLRSLQISGDSTVTDFHSVRILSKETRYVLEIARKFPAADSSFDALDKQLLGLHQALGAWHDLDVAVSDLDRYRVKLDSDTDLCRESYNRFFSALTTERDLQLELFRSRWIDFLAFLPVAG